MVRDPHWALRAARPDETEALSALALRAKASWGYAQAQIEAWRDGLTLVEPATRPVIVAEVAGQRAGFHSLRPGTERSSDWELDNLWVDPCFMRRGVGRALLEHAGAQALAAGARRLTIDADPHAEPFYLACGARRIGSVPAPIAGEVARVRPQLVLDLVHAVDTASYPTTAETCPQPQRVSVHPGAGAALPPGPRTTAMPDNLARAMNPTDLSEPGFVRTVLFTDSDGRARLRDEPIALDQGHPQSRLSALMPSGGLQLRRSPVGFRSDFHCSEHPQWVFILEGRMEIGLQDGSWRGFGPGQHFYSADLLPAGASFDPAQHGHRSRQAGEQPLVTLFVRG